MKVTIGTNLTGDNFSILSRANFEADSSMGQSVNFVLIANMVADKAWGFGIDVARQLETYANQHSKSGFVLSSKKAFVAISFNGKEWDELEVYPS